MCGLYSHDHPGNVGARVGLEAGDVLVSRSKEPPDADRFFWAAVFVQ